MLNQSVSNEYEYNIILDILAEMVTKYMIKDKEKNEKKEERERNNDNKCPRNQLS
ncbi:hypothetical protein [Metabacillus niabensis]|uniref:hypothetical protein n=1 Tax=Metabacillus niabensis TaxID=324854 RepID=UPI001CFAD430|nr:hypothetical protein [Metabacillus niabensis]